MSIVDEPASGRQPSAQIVTLVVLAIFMLVCGVAGFVIWTTSNNDDRSIRRDASLVTHYMQNEFENMALGQDAVGITDDAYANVYERFDRGWIDSTLGKGLYNDYSYEQVYVIDGHDSPVYAMRNGDEIKRTVYAEDAAVLAPMIAKLRGMLDLGALDNYVSGSSDTPPSVGDFAMISGTTAQVSIIPISAWSEGVQSPETPIYLYIAVDFLEASYSDFLGGQYLLEAPAFRTEATTNPDLNALPILNTAGRILTFFEWQPDRPGRRMLAEMVPALVGTLVAAGLLILFLLWRLWRYSAALEAGRARAQHLAVHDALTGLPNRALFETTLDRLVAARSTAGQPFAIMMLDLDRFKQVNDTLGHPAGDELIRTVALRLKGTLSSTGLVARLGGDEFAILEAGMASEIEATALAGRIIEVIGKPFDLSGNEASVGVSIGMMLAPPQPIGGADLLRKADIALYEAKAGGRNRPALYQDAMDAELQRRHAVEADLREALRGTDQISVVYEPIVEASTGHITGVAALPHWHHPKLGAIDPAIFMPVAEAAGLMEMLGEQILRLVAQTGRHWPDRTVSMPLTAAQIRNPRLFDRIFKILAETGMRPANLELELSERVLEKLPEAGADTLRKLSAAGVRIAVADFGTGQSALNLLDTTFISTIKLGPARIGQQPAAAAILQAVGNLARTMGLDVCGRDIVTAEQKAVLTSIGCTTLQGPAIGRPVDADGVNMLLDASPSAARVA